MTMPGTLWYCPKCGLVTFGETARKVCPCEADVQAVPAAEAERWKVGYAVLQERLRCAAKIDEVDTDGNDCCNQACLQAL